MDNSTSVQNRKDRSETPFCCAQLPPQDIQRLQMLAESLQRHSRGIQKAIEEITRITERMDSAA